MICLRPMKSRSAALVLVAACCLALAGCGTMKKMWPFGKKAKAGPEAVNELNLVNADGSAATYPQYWQRNTLIIDLSGISGTGSVAAKLPEETTWPVRVALRVRPGSVQQLEILGEERNILPVSESGTRNIDIEVAPSVYTPRTAAIYISWGAMPVFAEGAPKPEAATFVSPTTAPVTSAPADGEAPATSASDIIPPATTPPPN